MARIKKRPHTGYYAPALEKGWTSSKPCPMRLFPNCWRPEPVRLSIEVGLTTVSGKLLVAHSQLGAMAALGIPLLAGGSNEGKERKMLPRVKNCANEITRLSGVSRSGAC